MEYNKDLEASISQALMEVEKSLVDDTPLPKIREGVRLKTMEVRSDQNFMAAVPENLIRHQGVDSSQESCGTRRDDRTPHECDRCTSGPVSTSTTQKRLLKEPPNIVKAMINEKITFT